MQGKLKDRKNSRNLVPIEEEMNIPGDVFDQMLKNKQNNNKVNTKHKESLRQFDNFGKSYSNVYSARSSDRENSF